MKYLILLALVLTASKKDDRPVEKPTTSDSLRMECVDVGDFILRCENNEVICYSTAKQDKVLTCKFKPEPICEFTGLKGECDL